MLIYVVHSHYIVLILLQVLRFKGQWHPLMMHCVTSNNAKQYETCSSSEQSRASSRMFKAWDEESFSSSPFLTSAPLCCLLLPPISHWNFPFFASVSTHNYWHFPIIYCHPQIWVQISEWNFIQIGLILPRLTSADLNTAVFIYYCPNFLPVSLLHWNFSFFASVSTHNYCRFPIICCHLHPWVKTFRSEMF